ncbi:MAG TPA: hypothetical protein ENI87_00135 [bacterium]|nr:hypothetical protein [bacterium]
MSPQFVDFNGDGHLDIVCGIFDGSPHVAFGDGTHWRQPVGILDKEGQRIVMNEFWNFDTEQWDSTHRCDPDGGAPAPGHLTSAIAMDIDRDGDFDLVLGDHKSGYVYLRRNEGTDASPAFATRNELVMAGGSPMRDPGTVATLRSVDWNGDGRLDLMVGGMGDPYGSATGGGVAVYLDVGTGDATEFGPAVQLIEPSPKTATGGPTRPDSGLHPEAVDFDGDGDLGLIVGGYSHWTPEGPELTAAEQKELAQTKARLAEITARIVELNAEMLKAQEGLAAEAALELRRKLLQDPERKRLRSEEQKLRRRQNELEPTAKRVSFTWLYEQY